MSTRVLLYERPYTKKFFRHVAGLAFDNLDLTTVSEYKNISNVWLSTYLYDQNLDFLELITDEEIDDIICRCRTLRPMDYERAKRIVRRSFNGIYKLFEIKKFDYVLSLSIDNYLIDIIFRVAARFNVPVYSFVGTFVKGYIRFTLRGEHNFLDRGVTEEEIESTLKILVDKAFLPPSERSNFQNHQQEVMKFYYRRALIERIYYPLRKFITRDPDNARYNILNLQGTKFKDFVSRDLEGFFSYLSDIEIDRKTVFIFHYMFIRKPQQIITQIEFLIAADIFLMFWIF